MKKIFITALCAMLAVSSLSAQKHNYSNARNNKVMHKNVELTVYAAGNERFTVYIDGLPQSGRSGSRFTIRDITPNQTHDVAVVLERPIRYLLYTEMNMPAGKYDMEVYADARGNYAELYFTNERPNRQGNYTFNRFHFGDYGVGHGYGTHPTPPTPTTPTTPPTPPTPPVPQYCSEADMSIILSQISQEPFDDTRLNYLKTVTISKQPFTTEQIRRIASKFTFDNKRMEYVKYSFRYCYDVDNYFTLTDLFVHKSDKEKLMKFIQDNLR